jgi:hypothetical protein
VMQVRNLARLTEVRRAEIISAARELRQSLRVQVNGSNLST